MKLRQIIKNVLLFIVCLFTGSQVGQAQDQSMLFKIEGNGINPSYLFGTIHILPSKDFEMKDKVKSAFEDSDLVVLELDMDDPGLQASMMTHAMLPKDVTLDKLMSEEDYKLLDDELKEATGMGVQPFNSMKPFILTTMLLSKYLGDQPASYEGTFIQMAAANEKEILGLESIEEQMKVFEAIPYEDQMDDIVEMITDEEQTRTMFENMVDLYKNENITGLYNLFSEYYVGSQSEMDIMIHDRNENWIPKIRDFAEEQSVFFGVGAGHLGGEEGVVNLLRMAGYTVTAVQ